MKVTIRLFKPDAKPVNPFGTVVISDDSTQAMQTPFELDRSAQFFLESIDANDPKEAGRIRSLLLQPSVELAHYESYNDETLRARVHGRHNAPYGTIEYWRYAIGLIETLSNLEYDVDDYRNMLRLMEKESVYAELKGLLIAILREAAPSAAEVLQKLPSAAFRYLVTSNSYSDSASQAFAFGVSEKPELVLATLALVDIDSMTKAPREREQFERHMQQAWKSELIKAGVSDDLADRIPTQYTPELARLLSRWRDADNES